MKPLSCFLIITSNEPSPYTLDLYYRLSYHKNGDYLTINQSILHLKFDIFYMLRFYSSNVIDIGFCGLNNVCNIWKRRRKKRYMYLADYKICGFFVNKRLEASPIYCRLKSIRMAGIQEL